MSTVTTTFVVTPATSYSLISVAELKLMLGITDATQDAVLQLYIDIASSQVEALCNNRVFARETVIDTFTDSDVINRVFLSRFPVKAEDIAEVLHGDTVFVDYGLDERAGKILNPSGWTSPLKVTYTGGYELPDESPPALKAAVVLLAGALRSSLPTGISGSTVTGDGGIRMVAHKESRVMYYQSTTSSSTSSGGASGGGGAATQRAALAILRAYTRFWC
jgi:Phage gp6-like head-tail connector protein